MDEETENLVSPAREVRVGHPRHTFDVIIPQPRLRPPGIGDKIVAFILSRGKQRKGEMAALTGKPLLYVTFKDGTDADILRVYL